MESPRFEWDNRKAAANLRKHGVRFEDAITAFDDPNALIEVDGEHSDDELRERLIGRARPGVLVVIFTEREIDDDVTRLRIIGARRATKQERKAYEDRRAV